MIALGDDGDREAIQCRRAACASHHVHQERLSRLVYSLCVSFRLFGAITRDWLRPTQCALVGIGRVPLLASLRNICLR
jgi:hypothetical protein